MLTVSALAVVCCPLLINALTREDRFTDPVSTAPHLTKHLILYLSRRFPNELKDSQNHHLQGTITCRVDESGTYTQTGHIPTRTRLSFQFHFCLLRISLPLVEKVEC